MVELNTATRGFCHPDRLTFGDFQLDLRAGELRRGSIPLKLAPQQFTILAALAGRAGELVTRDELRAALWGDDAYVDFDAGLNFSIRQLRLALGDDAAKPTYIQTVPRRGYRFVAPVQPDAPAGVAVIDKNELTQHRSSWWMRVALAAMALLVVGLSVAYGSLAMSAATPAATPNPDTRIADAHAAHGFVALNDKWDWPEAERAFARSLQLDPNQEVALISLSRLHAAHGRFEAAIAYARRAVEAHPSSTRAAVTLGWAQLFGGDAEAARATCREALRETRTPGPARHCLMSAEEALGVDHSATWRRTLETTTRDAKPGTWFARAVLQARLGQSEAALTSLQRAVDAREPDATFLLVHPALVSLRPLPGFTKTVVDAGLARDYSEISAFSH